MHKGFLKAGAIFAMLSVIAGAFATHAIKGLVSDNALATFETAVRYQLYHAFALLFTGIIYRDIHFKLTAWAGRLFFAGILLFSGSLYFLSYLQATVSAGYRWVGIVTPFGGAAFIAGWICLLIGFFKKNNQPTLNA
jgi:uncharacterized membrane protein YgdD (TMEM256/DUF423 family)